MTTATVFPLRRPGHLAVIRAATLALTGRLVRLEARRNAMMLMLPPLAVLFYLDAYRTASGYPPLWDIRASAVLNKLLFDFVALAAGMSAWSGSREGRRRTGGEHRRERHHCRHAAGVGVHP